MAFIFLRHMLKSLPSNFSISTLEEPILFLFSYNLYIESDQALIPLLHLYVIKIQNKQTVENNQKNNKAEMDTVLRVQIPNRNPTSQQGFSPRSIQSLILRLYPQSSLNYKRNRTHNSQLQRTLSSKHSLLLSITKCFTLKRTTQFRGTFNTNLNNADSW